MTVNHILFNNQKYISAVEVVPNFVDLRLIGKTITRSNYQVYWYDSQLGLYNVDDSQISTTIPADADISAITSTGKITYLEISKERTPYFLVDFNASGGTYIKASDVMKRSLAGESL